MKNKIGKILAIMVCAVMVATVLAVAVQAGGNVIFDEFDDPVLPPEWTISPGKGSYSLTDNPGYLRYIIDAYGWGSGAKALSLVRPFSGDQWRLTTAITYDMRPASPTNNRNMHFCIRTPGEGGTSIAYIGRSVGVCDYNPGSNHMSLYAGSNGMPIYFPGSTPENCICPLPIERWYFEIERNKDNVTVKASNDGDDSTFEYECEYTFAPGVLGNDQVIEIYGTGWYGSNNPPGYADFDFIRVVHIPIPATIDIDSDTLNLKSKAKWITAYIELPEGFDMADINATTVLLEGDIPAVTDPKYDFVTDTNEYLVDLDGDSYYDARMVKFEGATVRDKLTPGDTVELTVTGKLYDGTPFEGSDTIRVID